MAGEIFRVAATGSDAKDSPAGAPARRAVAQLGNLAGKFQAWDILRSTGRRRVTPLAL